VGVVAQVQPQVEFERFAVASALWLFFADDRGEFSPDNVGVWVSFCPNVNKAAGFTMLGGFHRATMR